MGLHLAQHPARRGRSRFIGIEQLESRIQLSSVPTAAPIEPSPRERTTR